VILDELLTLSSFMKRKRFEKALSLHTANVTISEKSWNCGDTDKNMCLIKTFPLYACHFRNFVRHAPLNPWPHSTHVHGKWLILFRTLLILIHYSEFSILYFVFCLFLVIIRSGREFSLPNRTLRSASQSPAR